MIPAESSEKGLNESQNPLGIYTLKSIFWVSAGSLFLIGILDIIGWITGITLLKSLGPYWISMKPPTAICFLLIAITLILIRKSRPAGAGTVITAASILITLFISLLTIYTELYHSGSGRESSLVLLPVFSQVLLPEMRMPLVTALILTISGLIIGLLAADRPLYSEIAHFLCIPVAVTGYIIPLSYLLNIFEIHQVYFSTVALNTGIAFSAVFIAALAMRPSTILMRVFTNNNLGGVMARRLLPWIFVLPVLIGWMRIYGVKAGIFSHETGLLLVDVAYAFCFLLLIWITARYVSKTDNERVKTAQALKDSYLVLEEKVRERTSTLKDLNKTLDDEIIERIKAEEMVSAERERFYGILELMPAYLILLTPDYHVYYANRFFRERFGESHGKRCYEFLFNRTEPCDVCHTYETLRENRPVEWEWTGPDNHIYSIYDFPYKDTDGTPLIMEMGIDITSLKEAEAKLISLNAHLEEKVAERTSDFLRANERLQILSEVSAGLLATSNPQELIDNFCRRVMTFLDCQVSFNYLVDDEKGKLHLNAYNGIQEKTARKIEWLEFGEAVCGCVANEGQRIIVHDIQNSNDTRTGLVRSFGVQAYACHPIISNEKVIGTLSFGTKLRTGFSEDDLFMMKSVTDQVAIAMKRVRDEENLRKSKERYKKLLELSPSACMVNKKDSIELLNPAARRLLGIETDDEVLGTSPSRFFQSGFNLQKNAVIRSMINGDKVPMIEEKILTKSGITKDVEIASVAMVDSEGPTFQVIMNDITRRKLAEKELFETKNYLQNLIDYANAPIIVWDRNNKIRLFNHAFEHLTGYSSPEVEGRNLDLLFPQETLTSSMAKIRKALKENWKTIEIPILTKNNDIRIVLWNSAKVYDKNRNSFSIIAQGNDITERIKVERAFEESREKLEIALENGKIGIWDWEPASGAFIADIRMEKILGFEPGTFEKTYSAFEKCIHEEDLYHVRNALDNAVKNDITLDTIFRVRHKDNNINYISTRALVEKDKKGNPVKISGVCFDITEMKMGAEKVLFSLNEELLRSNKELEQFAYVASHDLQEPLRMVSSFTQLLARRYEDKLDQNAKEYIQFAVQGAARMQRLINDLLEYSRINTRGGRFSVTDMHVAVGQAISNLSIKIQESNGLVTTDQLPTVLADEGQMLQLMQNLIGNAIKFCKSSPRIHISSKDEDKYYLFSVKDNGIGIEPQYFNKIFQIFQRLHSKEDYGGGTGIGLAICKRIIERHGGKIWVESKKGKGSIFYFTLMKN